MVARARHGRRDRIDRTEGRSGEAHSSSVHTESVVLDIGLDGRRGTERDATQDATRDTGALIIYTTPSWRGREIEVSPRSDRARRVHTDVAERHVNGRTVFAAVFLPLPTGGYMIW